MLELILGIAAAIGASILYSLGVALQAMDAKRTSSHGYLRLSLARELVVRVRWLLGTGLSMLGWPLQLLALTLAPLVVVQPAMAIGLLVLLLVAERMLNERAGRREHLAVWAIVLGFAGAALCAPPNSQTYNHGMALTIVLVALALASLLPYILLPLHRPSAAVAMIAAGLGFGWSGVSTKLASDALGQGHIWVAVAWGIGTGIASAVATLGEMSALQSRPALQVAPVVFVTQTVVPVVLAPLLLGESFARTPLSGVPLSASLAVLVVGAAVLARSPLLLALMAGERVSDPSDSADRPDRPSQETMRTTPLTEALDPSAATTRIEPARVER
jgi:FtsH-binding integral membrane protein